MSVEHPLLKSHLRRNRVAPTYLFTGPDEGEKNQLALRFAQALNCEKGALFSSSPSPPTQECSCPPCTKIEKGTHPDVWWLGEDRETRSIKIEEIRSILHEASLKPFEGRWKVFILEGAERLTLEAANAFLKTLEEPPEHSVFILCVENKAHLLETIQSRAFEIRLPARKENRKENRDGSIFQEGTQKKIEPSLFFSQLESASRKEAGEALVNLMIYFRDRCAEERIERGDPPIALSGRRPGGARRPASRRYVDALDSVYETLEALGANVNQKLALTRLELRLKQILNG